MPISHLKFQFNLITVSMLHSFPTSRLIKESEHEKNNISKFNSIKEDTVVKTKCTQVHCDPDYCFRTLYIRHCYVWAINLAGCTLAINTEIDYALLHSCQRTSAKESRLQPTSGVTSLLDSGSLTSEPVEPEKKPKQQQ